MAASASTVATENDIESAVQSGRVGEMNGAPQATEDIGDPDETIDIEVFVEDADEATRLEQLVATVRDQDDLERDIGRQADQLLTEQADERDRKRLEKTQADRGKLQAQVRKLEQRLSQPVGSTVTLRLRAEIDHLQAQIQTLDKDLTQIQQRIDGRHEDQGEEGETLLEASANRRMPNESRRDFLIRTGKITPFSNVGRGLVRASSSFAGVMLDAEEGEEEEEIDGDGGDQIAAAQEPVSHRDLIKPGFAEDDVSDTNLQPDISERPVKRRKLDTEDEETEIVPVRLGSASVADDPEDDFVPEVNDKELAALGETEDEDVDEDVEGDFPLGTLAHKRKKGKKKVVAEVEDKLEDLAGIDDGNEEVYQARLQKWVSRRREARKKAKARLALEGTADGAHNIQNEDSLASANTQEEEWYLPHPTRHDAEFAGGYRIPGDIFPSLFDYQKVGVQWLWELYSQQVGGIVGDEMGLGKTIQVISFLAGLHYSKILTKPIIIVTPATVMKQWVNEFHQWWPPLRVSILHTSGSGMMDVKKERQMEDELESRRWDPRNTKMTRGQKAARRIVDRVVSQGHVLITTYSGLQSYAELLIPVDWEYAVLDEGHKIRNPNTSITIHCKELRTPNRIILSGTPMQNNLTELWSLFDFVFPMRLGTLVNFRNQFEIPIKQGGYANASNLQVETAMKCAETLKDAISSYLLQRYKVDVAADLPKKTEQVLFCRLTKIQRDAYEGFLASDEMKSILNRRRQALYGVDILRKICNHPDLVEHKTLSIKAGYNYGSPAKSGKMQVVKALLQLWKDTGHKTLLFAQHRIMLDILEKFVAGMPGMSYRRMDGNTDIKDRQTLVDEFNRDPNLHVFLLTTKVGGLGINLTGADRVIIYDPDWNPSTDVQARERAWRLGQKREVMIYRLMTAGTIEEKIYHRQIFKQFLTNKILRDPKQRQTFQLKDLHDLFTLGSANDSSTETTEMFKGTEVTFRDQNRSTNAERSIPTPPSDPDDPLRISDIAGISRQEAFHDSSAAESKRSSPQPDNPVSDETKPSNKDDRVLSSIFARSGVHSALEHDAIINGNRKIGADPVIIEREAKRVAAQAAKELKKAGEIAKTVPVGTPTWTGVVGTAGRPEDPPARGISRGAAAALSIRGGRGGARGGAQGPSSSSILAALQARQPGPGPSSSAPTPTGSLSRSSTPSSSSRQQQPRGREFLSLIRDFLIAHGGKVYTQMLIDHFNRLCSTPARSAEFKEMLKIIATLETGRGGGSGRGGSGGRGMWVLREEWKDLETI